MRFVIYSLLTYFLLTFYTSKAQKQASLWYFGRNNGLDFSDTPPKIITNGALNTSEGCATIADQEGRLLFYTDGMSVWDRTHKQMPNGRGLKGHWTSTQSAIIIPKPGDESIYYIFTADEGGYENLPNSGIHYSEVNMCLNNGFGDVVAATKNTFLYKPATERLSAVFHVNRTDVWVMTHEWGSNRFLAYLVTEQGVSGQPIISHSGSEHEYLTQNRIGYSNTIGEMKFSPNGKKLALAVQGQNLAQVFDFDATSGIVSNPVTLSEGFSDDPLLKPYGISFSANSKLLYVGASESRKIYQFNLAAGSAQTICESRYSIDAEKIPYYSVYGLQLALNGKIYVNQPNEHATYAGVIHDPDKPGLACRFNSQEINPGNTHNFYTWACFPNFISSYFDADPYITYQKACENTLYNFTIQNNLAVTTVEWQFGDTTTSEASNQSTELAPVHHFSKPGIYSVHARVSLTDGSVQELEKKIIVSPAFSLGNDTLLCNGESLLLDVSSQQGVYRWQDGSAKSTFTVKQSGVYWVDICTNGCSTRYTIEVTYERPLEVNLGADQIICDDKPVLLSAHTKFASLYTWQDGSTNASFIIYTG
ncbi:PKD domain-containing protein [Rhodocytophaga aerolata]|uniref:PKD domain-containing protein n=1 Tax=Rhodocytophaga aerolata TaxID=455078 RepID=A0ABT8RJY4_9BACT|nr:PKD domain-containing protein [Rhodocytophaga aerolata]MDO1451137.1 PKD domain-containing protein [Rhodocytophaga aerolata]